MTKLEDDARKARMLNQTGAAQSAPRDGSDIFNASVGASSSILNPREIVAYVAQGVEVFAKRRDGILEHVLTCGTWSTRRAHRVKQAIRVAAAKNEELNR